MKLYQLYLITNLVNNKKYVGQVLQSRGYLKRFKAHKTAAFCKNSTYVLHQAMRKYGTENFQIKLLLHNIPETQIDYYETLWIDKLDTYFRNGHGYNMTTGGQGVHGLVVSEKTKKVQSEKMIAYWTRIKENPAQYQEICSKRSERHKGIKFTNQHKKHLSERASERTGEKNPFYNKHHSNSTKNKISEANSKCIGMFDKDSDELLCTFKSLADATAYLVKNGITSNKSASSRISKICNGIDKSAYGFSWRFI